jgi:hypothetical protein
MKKSTYRFRSLIIIVIFLIPLLESCDEDEKIQRPNPTIEIISNAEFVSYDTTLSVGQAFTVGIHAEYNGHNKLTNFIAKLNGENYLDLGLYTETFDREVEIKKGLEDIEEWGFIIRDFEGNASSVSITIDKDPNIVYGDIYEYPDVHLGAQNSLEYGSFFSFENGNVYTLENAFNNQEIIDLTYYYDDFDALEENIIASPGANLTGVFSGINDIANWEIKNTTRYSREELDVTIDEFDNAHNDSILIANSFAFESGGRKTKFLKAGDVYSFVRNDKTGMFKVVNTSGTTNGYIVVDIKIQK